MAPCSLWFLEDRQTGLKGSTIYWMTDRMPYPHTWGKLIFFQRQALGKTDYINLLFSNTAYTELGKARMYQKGELRSLSVCQSCGYQQTGVQVWRGGGRCQSLPWGGKLCWWGWLQSSLILICPIQNYSTSHVTWPCCHCAWPSGQSLVLPGFTWSLRPERSQRLIVITSSSQTVASSSLLFLGFLSPNVKPTETHSSYFL